MSGIWGPTLDHAFTNGRSRSPSRPDGTIQLRDGRSWDTWKILDKVVWHVRTKKASH